MFAILARFIVGTAHDERMQTSFKLLDIKKSVQLLLFLSYSKKPVAIHCIAWQSANVLLLCASFVFKLPIMICFEIYVALFSAVFISLCVETVWIYVFFDSKWEDENSILCADFRDGKYKLLIDGKYVDGYLDRYFKRRCAFYNENDEILFSAKYKYSLKEKNFCIAIDGGETLSLRPV